LQTPFIENEDAEIRIGVETRTTDWSMLQGCNAGEWAKIPFTYKALITHSPQSRTSFAGYWRSDPTLELPLKRVSNGLSVPGMILLLFARDGSCTPNPCHLSLTARRARTHLTSVCPFYRNMGGMELWQQGAAGDVQQQQGAFSQITNLHKIQRTVCQVLSTTPAQNLASNIEAR